MPIQAMAKGMAAPRFTSPLDGNGEGVNPRLAAGNRKLARFATRHDLREQQVGMLSKRPSA